ncbi:hypothetical protein [Streptomyces sp. NPDC059142]|uniref:hypothetical protein n=1 Tax=Streptomyces sp. NPDC059142 TaxID=3346739 RepID=UPI0036CF21F6
MPLSVPLLLVPGHPDRFYTVHVHRARWDADAVTGPLAADPLAPLEDSAREGLRMVSECIAAELADAEVKSVGYPDGSAEAVARVLCDSQECAAVAEQYRRDADEEIEAEAARAWAATKLQGKTVELLCLRAELERTTPGKRPAGMLAAVLAVQQERTGGATDRVTLTLDEAAHLLRENDLFHDQSPEGVRREIDRLIRQNRAPYPTDFDSAPDSVTWVGPARGTVPMLPANEVLDYLGRQNATELTPEHCEKVGEPDPDAPAARAWALTQASAGQEARDMAQERADAKMLDANLVLLRQSDPDADRIFRPGIFTAQLDAPGSGIGLGAALELYAAAKRDQGRMDLFHALFVGTTAEDSR